MFDYYTPETNAIYDNDDDVFLSMEDITSYQPSSADYGLDLNLDFCDQSIEDSFHTPRNEESHSDKECIENLAKEFNLNFGTEECLQEQQQWELLDSSDTFGTDLFDVFIPSSPISTCSTKSIQSSMDSSAGGSNGDRSSKFDHSTLVEKKNRKKVSQKEEKSVKKRVKKAVNPASWQHTKFSESASYLELSSNSSTFHLGIEVFQTPRRQNGPLESDRLENMKKIGDLSYTIEALDTSKTNFISLKGKLDKKAIYGDTKPSRVHTWIKVNGTNEFLFLYCQTGKTQEVHNIISVDKEKNVITRSDNLSRYSGKCSHKVHFNGFTAHQV